MRTLAMPKIGLLPREPDLFEERRVLQQQPMNQSTVGEDRALRMRRNQFGDANCSRLLLITNDLYGQGLGCTSAKKKVEPRPTACAL